MVKSRALIVTGKTEQQWIDELTALEFSEELGLEALKNRPCYLCKRAGGDKSICFVEGVEGEDDELEMSNIELNHYEIESEDGAILSYLLCAECALLMGVMDKMKGNSE